MMKIRIIHQILTILLCLFFVLSIKGQDSQEPVLFFTEDFTVKPSQIANFKEAVKEFIKIYEDNEVAYRWDTYQTEDFHFYFTTRLKDYADIDNMFSAVREMTANTDPEKLEKINQLTSESTDSFRYGLYYYRPDLSYIPANINMNNDDPAYMQWSWFYLFPEKQADIEEIAARWVEEYKSENISMPYYVWTGHIGDELPLYLYVWVGKDQEDFQRKMAEISQKLGEKSTELRDQTYMVVKKMKIQRGWSLPGFSYIPSENK